VLPPDTLTPLIGPVESIACPSATFCEATVDITGIPIPASIIVTTSNGGATWSLQSDEVGTDDDEFAYSAIVCPHNIGGGSPRGCVGHLCGQTGAVLTCESRLLHQRQRVVGDSYGPLIDVFKLKRLRALPQGHGSAFTKNSNDV
jgi:hypothetical protein